mmetsp:Transcript_2816/g.6459  ORF Transcript_2816/g.6459 Transcript_2816/m.6459 type:complete len:101 (+) Transcript_2816:139-441(+)
MFLIALQISTLQQISQLVTATLILFPLNSFLHYLSRVKETNRKKSNDCTYLLDSINQYLQISSAQSKMSSTQLIKDAEGIVSGTEKAEKLENALPPYHLS